MYGLMSLDNSRKELNSFNNIKVFPSAISICTFLLLCTATVSLTWQRPHLSSFLDSYASFRTFVSFILS